MSDPAIRSTASPYRRAGLFVLQQLFIQISSHIREVIIRLPDLELSASKTRKRCRLFG